MSFYPSAAVNKSTTNDVCYEARIRLKDWFYFMGLIAELQFGLFGIYESPLVFQGEEGVREVLQILNDEFRLSMALSGERVTTKENVFVFFPNSKWI